MKALKKYTMFFAIGAIGYGAIELLWRGHTHWSMLIAGGICFICFSLIAEKFEKFPLLCKAVICALCVTLIELLFGILFNLFLKMNIWDYSSEPFNFLGQICPLFTAFWGVLGFVFIPLASYLNKKLDIHSNPLPRNPRDSNLFF